MPGYSAYLKNPAFLFLTSYLLPLSIHSSFLFFSSCTNISRSESKDKRIYYFFIYYLLFKMPGYSAYLKTRHFLFLISYSLPLTSFHSFLISQSSFLFLTSYSLPLTSHTFLISIPYLLPLTPYFFFSLIPYFYFGAVLYKYIPIRRNTTFGNQTALNAVIAPLTENEVDMVENSTYRELNASPIPR